MIKTILSSITSNIFIVMLFASSTLMAQTPNNISIQGVNTPMILCASETDSLRVAVVNYGSNQIDSFMVVWEVDNLLDSAWFYEVIPPAPGFNMVNVSLSQITMLGSDISFSVWTKWPNGVSDS